jgi:LysR family transcriptional regulator, nitrogen assimilation regulatory protein
MPREEQLTRSTRIIVRLVREEIKHLVDSGVWKAQLQY